MFVEFPLPFKVTLCSSTLIPTHTAVPDSFRTFIRRGFSSWRATWPPWKPQITKLVLFVRSAWNERPRVSFPELVTGFRWNLVLCSLSAQV